MLKQYNNSILDATNHTMLKNETYYGHHLSSSFIIPISITFTITSLGGIVFNFILICIILSEKQLRSITSNIFMVNLAIGDLITAVFIIPFDVDYMIRGYFPYNTIICGINKVGFLVSLSSSVNNLFMLTLDRYISVKYPFKRMRYFTSFKITMVVAFGWIYAVIFGAFPIIYNYDSISQGDRGCVMIFPMEYAYVWIFVNGIFPGVCIIILNILLFNRANKRPRSLQATIQAQRVSLSSNMKAAKTILMLVVIFLICWLLYCILVLWNILCGVCHPREVTWIGNAINYSSVTLNPLVYGFRNKIIKSTLKRFSLKISRSKKKINRNAANSQKYM